MKILNVVGARPNFVKIAPLIREMRQSPDIDPLLVHTGQHYDAEMSDTFFRDLKIPYPNYNLRVQPGSPAAQMREIMGRLGPVIARERPEVVLVVGDVNSTLAAALAAARLGVPVAHVEAGLRSFDRRMPEEINRVMTDAVADLLFVTEPSGVENLLREGKPPERIFLVGNVMIDTLRQVLGRTVTTAAPALQGPVTGRPQTSKPAYAVLTLHRQGLVDDPVLFGRIWKVLQEIGQRVPIIFPVHPRTQLRLRSLGCEALLDNGGSGCGGIHMVPPLGYLEFLSLQKQAAFVLTDSGGVQEETTALGVPCLTLRENTERPFTVTDGTNRIVGFDAENIRREVGRVLSGEVRPSRALSLWDGRAAERIVRILRQHFARARQNHSSRVGPFNAFAGPFRQHAAETEAKNIQKKMA
jgi:UDP-N-acetylglucosamine 2-epimerase (non-hydrolysing)